MPRPKKAVPKPIAPSEPPVAVSHESDRHAGKFLLFFMFVKATLLALGIVLASFVVVGAIIAYSYLHTVASHAGMGIRDLYAIARQGWNESVPQANGETNFLLLGIDTLATRSNEAINTDTIMVASVNLKAGKINTFSIPRDLFLQDRREKINSVYNTALKAGKSSPELETKTAVEQLTGIPVQHVILLQIDEVGKLIDALGGITVNVDRAFTDTQFPREGVDVAVVHDPKLLYETVSFQAGSQQMDGKTALQFIRSRHSLDPLEGTDDARALRQQKVIEALVSRLSNRSIVRNPAYIGELIKLYREDFNQYVPMPEMVALGKVFLNLKRSPSFQSRHFAIKGTESDPVLYHPDRFYTGQWVYLPVDPSGKLLKDTVAGWLK